MSQQQILSAVTWGVLTMVAALGSAANQDWHSPHGATVGAAAVLAVVGAALKTFPTFGSEPAAPAAQGAQHG